MTPKITESDLLDALREALTRPSNGQGTTVQEIAEATGHSCGLVRSGPQRIAREGRLVVAKVGRPSIDGRMFQVPAYRIKAK